MLVNYSCLEDKKGGRGLPVHPSCVLSYLSRCRKFGGHAFPATPTMPALLEARQYQHECVPWRNIARTGIPAQLPTLQLDSQFLHTCSHDAHSNASGEFQHLPSSSRFFSMKRYDLRDASFTRWFRLFTERRLTSRCR